MGITGIPVVTSPRMWRCLGLIAACVLLAAFLSACGEDPDTATSERVLALEAKVHSLEESLEILGEENASLQSDLDTLRREQALYVQAQEEAKEMAEEREQEATIAGQAERLAVLEEEQGSNAKRLSDLEDLSRLASETAADLDGVETRLKALEIAAAEIEGIFQVVERAFIDLDKRLTLLEGTVIEKTVRLAQSGGGKAQVINFGAAYGAAKSAVLVLPNPLPEGKIPLIVSLHGFGGDSFSHGRYIPFHDRVNTGGFALLLPNGTVDPNGNRFWSATGWCCDLYGSGVDDVESLSALVEEASGEFDMGPVYFFGHSNGGFMSYRMACEGLPGLRAVASLAGTGYVDPARCDGAAPVSVLHIHGEKDEIIRFHGSEESQLPALTPNESYAGAKDMYYRWGERAGCDPNSEKDGEEHLDLDAHIEGPETFTYRFTEDCAEGITLEIWSSDEGGHTPGYGDAFADALLEWLLAQE